MKINGEAKITFGKQEVKQMIVAQIELYMNEHIPSSNEYKKLAAIVKEIREDRYTMCNSDKIILNFIKLEEEFK